MWKINHQKLWKKQIRCKSEWKPSTSSQVWKILAQLSKQNSSRFCAPGYHQYGKNGKLAELNLRPLLNEFVKDVNNENIVNRSKARQSLYVSNQFSTVYMAMNKMLEDAQVTKPCKRRIWTTDDFEKVLKALKDKATQVHCSVLVGGQGARAFIANLYGGSVTDKM